MGPGVKPSASSDSMPSRMPISDALSSIDPPTPQESVCDRPGERRMLPIGLGTGLHRHHVLMRHDEEGSSSRIGTAPGEEQRVSADQLTGQARVNERVGAPRAWPETPRTHRASTPSIDDTVGWRTVERFARTEQAAASLSNAIGCGDAGASERPFHRRRSAVAAATPTPAPTMSPAFLRRSQ